jgi:K+-transporting ATPase ATPase C chain
MLKHLRACLWLLVVTVVLCSVAYPLVLLGIGKLIFPRQADGSLIERSGTVVGSRLIAQPFGSDPKYFQPRPSTPSYDASNSGASNYAANNYVLRDRVAQALGPIARYAGGAKKGDLVGPDIDNWFKADKFHDQSGIVAQWAGLHSTVAQNWIKGDPLNSAYVADWQKSHPSEVAEWIKANPATPEPKPEDLAVPFFTDFSKSHPGSFLKKTADGKGLELATGGDEIRKAFFDMWLTDHPDVELEKVPADMVMASGSGLDPHITRENALWQLEHMGIAAAWAKSSGGDEAKVRAEIRKLVDEKASAPWGGLIGVPLINVLELNLALEERFKK